MNSVSSEDYNRCQPDTNVGLAIWMGAVLLTLVLCAIALVIRHFYSFHLAWLLLGYPIMAFIGARANIRHNKRLERERNDACSKGLEHGG